MRQSQQKSSAFLVCWNAEEASMANSVDPDQTAPTGAVFSGSTLFAYTINSSVMLGNYLQHTTSADDILDAFFFGALRVNCHLQIPFDFGPINAFQCEQRILRRACAKTVKAEHLMRVQLNTPNCEWLFK